MRDFKGMKRQRNRGRGGGGGNGGGGGGKPQHNANRAFDSNGPDNVKVRGDAQHIYEKYQQLARDAGSGGDRVLAENYLQHAEHYFRVLRAMQPQRPLSEIIGRDQFVSGYDIDFEEEPQAAEEGAPAEAEADAGGEGRREDRQWQRDERPREDRQQQGDYRQQNDRQQNDRPQGEYRQRDGQGEYRQRDDRPRDDRPRDDRPREDRPREDRQQQGEYRQRDDRARDDRPRDDRPRDDRPREDRYQGDRQGRARDDRQGRYQNDRPRQDREYRDRNGGERPERDPLSVIEPQATPLVAPAAAYEQPRESDAGVLRGEDGAVSHAPAFLQTRAEPRAEGEEPAATPRPRRRRAPRSFEPGVAAPVEADEG